ncbi:tRNA A64-2'-O-ribosylphosphate transferase [Umbelopsis sp. PMI_123]|nr:tRNA A64-2'-O-ribosylphosphate transferase [Umbelopsis sp. PMI_123]
MEDLRAHGNFMKHSEQIRQDHKNVYNRLKSIQEDAGFVNEISALFPQYAIVANERCGSWYIEPELERKHVSVYFKSTDGHTGQWKFNLRRMNLHLIDAISATGGCIIVDSTRRGKRIPDALSKTIPIWCAVLNRAIAKSGLGGAEWESELHTLPSIISLSEHAQIAALIDEFTENLLRTKIDLEEIRKKLKKPLRPLWYTPQSKILYAPDYTESSFLPVICLSASQFIEGGSQARNGYMYVQGSGDDEESWSLGLTAPMFWRHQKELLNCDASTCEQLAIQIAASSKDLSEQDAANLESYTYVGNSKIAIGTWKSGEPPLCWDNFDIVINCTDQEYPENKKDIYSKRYLHLNIPASKKGQHVLFSCVPIAVKFCKDPIASGKSILVHGIEGKDRAVGIALALLIQYYDTNGTPNTNVSQTPVVDKIYIQQHLINIMNSRPQSKPSRATLKKINTFFMS